MKSLLIGFLAAVAAAQHISEGFMTQYDSVNYQDGRVEGIDEISDNICIYENDGTFYNFIKLRNKDA